MNNTLIDNSTETLKMVSVLKECIASDSNTEILIATGYWDMPGIVLIYDELKSFLERNDTSLKLLIGKEPLVRLYQQTEPRKRDDFPGQYIKTDIDKLQLTNEFQKAVNLIMDYCADDFDCSKFQIKIYGQGEVEQFLHAKCYIFNGKTQAYGIVGSSNFTKKGLEDNAELNYLETSRYVVNYQSNDDTIKGHIGWFKEKWEQSEPWNKVFLEEILKPSPIEEALKKLKDAHAKQDLAAIDAATTELNNVFQAASQEMYNAQQQPGGQANPQSEPQANPNQGAQGGQDAEVTDVDFEEVK